MLKSLDENGHLLLLRSLRGEGNNLVSVLDYPETGLDPYVLGAVANRCGICGEHPVYEITDDVVRPRDACRYPQGITSKITLDVPSGRIIVTDDLRPTYRVHDDDLDYNTALGQHVYIQRMAAIGCAYGPVGNSCPGLWRTGPDQYVIAHPPWDDDTDFPKLTIPGAKELASICTDLWAYSIADYEHWLSRGGDPDAGDWTDTVVHVTPGRYQFTHHTGERGFDRDADEVIFAHVKRIGDVP